jgi:hypothetical protein
MRNDMVLRLPFQLDQTNAPEHVTMDKGLDYTRFLSDTAFHSQSVKEADHVHVRLSDGYADNTTQTRCLANQAVALQIVRAFP